MVRPAVLLKMHIFRFITHVDGKCLLNLCRPTRCNNPIRLETLRLKACVWSVLTHHKHFAILPRLFCRKAFVVRQALPFAGRISIVPRNCSVTTSVLGFLLFWSRSNSLQSRSGDCGVIISQYAYTALLLHFRQMSSLEYFVP